MSFNIFSSTDHSGNKKRAIGGLLYTAYEDYIGARLLFLNGLPIQACMLGNTCLEKLFKAILNNENINYRGLRHDTVALYNKMTHLTYRPTINESYLEALVNIYECRYIGEKSPGFNFTILKNKFLAELDYSVDMLSDTIKAISKPIPGALTAQDFCNLDKTKEEVVRDNYIYLGIEKTNFCEQVDDVIEYRILSDNHAMLMTYKTNESTNDGNFVNNSIPIGVGPRISTTTHTPTHRPLHTPMTFIL